MPHLGIFGLNFRKNYCHIRNQHPQICQIPKIRGKTAIPKFWTKNGLFKKLGNKLLSYYKSAPSNLSNSKNSRKKDNWVLLGIFGLNFRKKLLSYMNSGTSNLSICKILRKNKNTRFWNKMPVLGIFELEFENNIVKIEITTLQFV